MKSDHLHQLIHSLSKSEKRYIKLSASAQTGKNDESNYIRLFEAIEKHKKFNEEDLIKQFKGESFTNQFHVVKNYLYNYILKCLSNYHQNLSASTKLREYLQQIEILYHKKLFESCLKHIKKAKKIAITYNHESTTIELQNWYALVINMLHSTPSAREEISNLFDDNKQRIARQVTTDHFRKNLILLINLYRKHGIPGTARQDMFQQIKSDPVIQDISQTQTYVSREYYYRIHFLINYIENNLTQARNNLMDGINWMESHPHQKQDRISEFVNLNINMLTILQGMRDYNSLQKYIKNIRNLQIKTIFFNPTAILLSYNIEFNAVIKTANFDKISELSAEIHSKLTTHRKSLLDSTVSMLYLNMARGYFFLEDYHEVSKNVKHLFKISNSPKKIREDIYILAKTIQILLHYESGNIELALNLTTSISRYIKKQSNRYSVDSNILTALINAIKKTDLNIVHTYVNSLSKRSKNSSLLTTELFLDCWLLSKLKKRKFTDILTEKSEQV